MKNNRKFTVLAAAASFLALVYQSYDADSRNADASFATLGSSTSQSITDAANTTSAQSDAAVQRIDAIDNDILFAATTDGGYATTNTLADGSQYGNGPVGPSRADMDSRKADDKTESVSPRSKMSGPVAELAAIGGDGMVELVVRYDQHPELFDDERVAELGGEVLRTYEVLNMRAIRISAAALEDLAIDDNVDWLSLDDEIMSTAANSRAGANVPAHASANGAFAGDGVGIAVLDTGVALHADLSDDIKQYSFLNGNYPTPTLSGPNVQSYNDDVREDGFGHGTHVAGILAGSGAASGDSYRGTAKAAPILSLQVLDQYGGGSMSDVMAALDWLLVYGDHFDIQVVNMSLGKAITESNETDPLVIAVENLWDAGIVVVVAAGNYGHYGNVTVTSPGNSRKIITVGSVSQNGTGTDFSDDYVSTFSSTGPTLGDSVLKPDLVAPGNRLVATIPDGSVLATDLSDRIRECTASGCDSVYLEMSGTSMATPMVSAAVALVLQKDPGISPATVKARLMRSARSFDNNFIASGAGILDVDAAMNDAGVISGEALSPLVFEDTVNGGIIVEDTGDLWGDSSWSAGYLFSDTSVWTDDFEFTDVNGVTSSGFAWTDGGIDAHGFGWTDGVNASGFGWTDGGVDAHGFGWTDHVGPQSLLSEEGTELVMNDDP